MTVEWNINVSERRVSFVSDHAESVLKPYEFKMEEIEGFRYRCRVSILVMFVK